MAISDFKNNLIEDVRQLQLDLKSHALRLETLMATVEEMIIALESKEPK